MAKIRISGVPALDGEYEFDPDFTNRDLNTIKKVSGVRAGELEDAFDAGDNDLLIAIAAIAVTRAGKVPDKRIMDAVELLMLAPAGSSLDIIGDEPEDDASPPDPSSPKESESD